GPVGPGLVAVQIAGDGDLQRAGLFAPLAFGDRHVPLTMGEGALVRVRPGFPVPSVGLLGAGHQAAYHRGRHRAGAGQIPVDRTIRNDRWRRCRLAEAPGLLPGEDAAGDRATATHEQDKADDDDGPGVRPVRAPTGRWRGRIEGALRRMWC